MFLSSSRASIVSYEPRRLSFDISEQHHSEDLLWDRVPEDPASSSVPVGFEQCGVRRIVSSQSDSMLRGDPFSCGIQRPLGEVVCNIKPLCFSWPNSHLFIWFLYEIPWLRGLDSMLQFWDGLQAYAFPPFAIIGSVLNKVRSSFQLDLTLIALLRRNLLKQSSFTDFTWTSAC